MSTASPFKTAALALLTAAATLGLGGCGSGSGGGSSSAEKTANPGGSSAGVTALADLKVGDCTSPTSDSLFVTDMAVVDCSEPHAAQLMGRFDFDGAQDAAYPGFLAIQQGAYTQCEPIFERFTGAVLFDLDSSYDISSITPSASSWADGDRTALCLLVDIDGIPLTASAN